jgi:transketolase
MTEIPYPTKFLLSPDEKQKLQNCAVEVRKHIIHMTMDGGCFIGASLSCVDILVYLYSRVLSISPGSLADNGRDYFLISKGHAVPALYGTLVEHGFIAADRLRNHLSTEDNIYWHPNAKIAGIEFHSGSLGHMLSVGMGIACDIRLRGGENQVYVLVGDGELNEGSVWETCQVAAAMKLSNLTLIVDRNGFQANCKTEALIPLEPLDHKFDAFGWSAARVDGHDFDELHSAFAPWHPLTGAPKVIIAETVRGRGVRSIENRADRWFANVTHEEAEALLAELEA